MARFKRAYPRSLSTRHSPPPAAAVAGTGTPQPAISPVIGYQRRTRARLGPASAVAAGIASQAVTAPPVLSTALGTQRRWIARTVPRTRGRSGGISAPATETTMPALTGVITIRSADGSVTVWNITGTPAS